MRLSLILTLALVFAISLGCSSTPDKIDVAAQGKLERDASETLKTLYAESPAARDLGKKAAGILVFSNIVKAGFIGGADYGKGVLKKGKKTEGYYNFVSGSVGFQAGFQSYDYVLFFMKQKDLDALNNADGFEVGVGPSIVALDAGAANNLTTTTGKANVYSFILSQRGLMGALNLEGSKITRIKP